MKAEILSILSAVSILASCSSEKHSSHGLVEGRLAECPDKPNCVSSMSGKTEHYIEPVKYKGDFGHAKNAVLEAVNESERAKIITVNNNYVHAEFRSAIFRFVDDVEFLIADDIKTIHIRSASRIGYSDMGVNRKRVEKLRTVINSKLAE